MKVYTVEMGEQHEGGSVYGTYASESGALKCARRMMKESIYPEGWTKARNLRLKYTLSVVHAWDCACDWVVIHEREVFP